MPGVREVTAGELLWLVAKFAAVCLVTLRVSWLLVEDEILAPLRDRWVTWARDHGWLRLALFPKCEWCIGLWATAAIVGGLVAWGRVSIPAPVLWPAAVNMVVALLHGWLETRLLAWQVARERARAALGK